MEADDSPSDTFGGFPEHLRTLVSHALPNVGVQAVIYPKFETRGDLQDCVGRFREWLQNKVIDLEVAAATPSPTIEPSVHVILIGHSMGGIVAAETLLSITSDSPIPTNLESTEPKPSTAAHTENGTFPTPPTPQQSTLMFPHISGILAFDTPYLGISPGVIAHGAETHYRTASTAYSAISEVAGVFGYGAAGKGTPSPTQAEDPQKLLTQGADAMTASMTASSQDAAATPTWQRWGKYAMFAGAAGAVAAGGAAAYLKRDSITEGWSFLGSHLEFVGCLAKGEELKSRLERVVNVHKTRGVGFANLFTILGKSAVSQKKEGTKLAGGFVEVGAVDGTVGPERTFCTIPKSERNLKFFERAKNDRAKDEVDAHMRMFERSANSGYFGLAERAKALVVEWIEEGVDREWYVGSQPEAEGKRSMGLMDVELDDDVDDVVGGARQGNPWAGEEPVIVEK